MTLKKYLKFRRRWETLAIFVLFVLIVVINATTNIIENYREGQPLEILAEFLLEITSNASVVILIVPILLFINWLNLSFANFRWRVLWHVPALMGFILAHVVMMILLRKVIWAVAGDSYEYGSLAMNLLYESRKDLLTYLLIVMVSYAYNFILDRLQGEARFLAEGGAEPEISQYKQQFLVKMLNTEFLVKVDEIESVNSASNYVLLNCGKRSYPMRQTMAGLLEQLDPAKFMRVHRTAIVNLQQVSALSDTNLLISLQSGTNLPVSKTYLTQLRQALLAGSD